MLHVSAATDKRYVKLFKDVRFKLPVVYEIELLERSTVNGTFLKRKAYT